MAETALPPADLLPVGRRAHLPYRAVRLIAPPLLRLLSLADPPGLVKRRFQWWLIRTTGGYVPVVRERRGDPALYHHVDRCLEVGGAVAIFPEGNYGPTEGEMMPFKKGFAHFAIKAGVPVVPVALSGTKDLWLRKPIRVIIGEPISASGMDPTSLTRLAFETIGKLLPRYERPSGRQLLRRWLTHLF